MEDNQEPGKLGSIRTYLFKALKFYDMKTDYITPVLFIIVLAISFAGNFVPVYNNSSNIMQVLFFILSIVIIQTAYTIYLTAYIKELKREECSFKSCFNLVLYNLIRIVVSYAIYMVAMLTGFVLLIIPGIVIYIMFIFYICYIMDQGRGITEAFKASKELTDGKKWEMFGIIVAFYLVTVLPTAIILLFTLTSNNSLILTFVMSFMVTVANFMHERLVALMYIDLEYGRNE